ncbi:hypothetical protein O181_033866 [Austropuccinia psidii MF-1]|uniref:Reverse transcriptase Ty1/copia-type domain-containing protein n=1 Tax=Austropuccinia psidii MF-1 TaxID=1389203 RepID=A0A9Q3D588_9BASI|nr:hypothetical protein [Austropuccinia psidii MF-1]
MLVSCNLNPENILPYNRQPLSLITSKGEAPKTFKSTLNSSDKDLWLVAINKELESMNALGVWHVVELDSSFKLVGTTWVFKIKKDHLGNITEYKARLCAQGFTQSAGIDFNQTYAPAGRLNSLQTLIAFAAAKDLKFHQIDIKTIYGLKQAPLAWYDRLKKWLTTIEFMTSVLDLCVFFWRGEHPVWLYIHVDDIAIFGSQVEDFKAEILKEFKIKDVGPADPMLGIKVTHFPDYISLDQPHFIDSLLELYGMSDCNPVATPLVPNEHLSTATSNEISEFEKLKVHFQSTVGSINYLSTATRPYLSFAVSSLSQHLEKPGILHWKSFLHVLKYLRGTQDIGLTYPRCINVGIVAYTDADWGHCCISRRSVTGFLATVGGSLVLWKMRKKPSVSLSTAKAEYKALCDLTSEIMWLKQWCCECDFLQLDNSIPVHEDNQSCINVIKGDCNLNNKQMKHVNIQLHSIKEALKNNMINLIYTPTTDMLADFLTKSVSQPILARSLDSLGVLSLGKRGDVEY